MESTVRGYLRRASTVSKDRGGKGLIKEEWRRVINRTYKQTAKLYNNVFSKRLPLTTDILRKIKPFLDPTQHNDRALWAVLCLGVFTLARIGELLPTASSNLKMSRKDLYIRGDKGTLFLIGTKTDKERKGVELPFFRNGTDCCPIAAMNAYLTGAGLKSKSPLFVDQEGKRMTQATVVSRMRQLLDKAGLRGTDFSGISLRRGGAQTLLRLGASDKIIMAMGRWRSVCFRRYLRVAEVEMMEWQMKMAKDKK